MDIDIDTPVSFKPEKFFPWTRASMIKNEDIRPHTVGYYPQNVAVDPMTGLCAIPYEEAESLGYLKIDFLHLGVYSHFQSREEIDALLEIEPDWGLLLVPSEQKKIFQLANHGDLLDIVKPRSLDDLADCNALIRPGKKSLLKLYLSQKEATRKILYSKDERGYTFKKSHAVAYAMVIVLQLHLISAGLI